MKGLARKPQGRFFAIVIVAQAVDGALFQALQSAQPAVIQIGGDFVLVLSQHREKLASMSDLLRLAGLEPVADFILFEEFDSRVVTPGWIGEG
jgi:hypothetical protein